MFDQNNSKPKLWWMSGANNWTPWCASSLLGASMHLIDDTDRLASITYRLMQAVDRFIENYSPDGGCDEGPTYWGHATGKMIKFLELLYTRTNGAISIYDEPIINEMSLFITRAYLDGGRFSNFADASSKVKVIRAMVYQLGERTNNERMKQFAIYSMHDYSETSKPVDPITIDRFPEMIREIFWMPKNIEPIKYKPELEVWLPDLQTLVSRDSVEHNTGLILAAKAGNNDESHNHNDIGQFIIMSDGQPIIIDLGNEHYTNKTFGKDRYTLWACRSSGHNVPLINDNEQCQGKDFSASKVSFVSKEGVRTLSMNLENTYDKKAGINLLHRTITHSYNYPSSIQIVDQLELENPGIEFVIPMYSIFEPEIVEDGLLEFKTKKKNVLLKYDPANISAVVTSIIITDALLESNWGEKLYKIELIHQAEGAKAIFKIGFSNS